MLLALAGPAKISAVVALIVAWGAISDRSDAEFAWPVGASSSPAQEGAATGVFHGVGVVTAVDNAKGWLTLDHEAIKGFMCAMEMMYRVEPATLVSGLHVGERVGFDIDASRETIVGVNVAEPAR
jgi:Cu/Ag efflux protein CusF